MTVLLIACLAVSLVLNVVLGMWVWRGRLRLSAHSWMGW